MRSVASVSFGKDSTAMVLRLINEKWPLEEVFFYDTGVEFDPIYRTRDRIVRDVLEPCGVKYTELRPKRPFLETMLEHEYISRKGQSKKGYGWCGGMARWGTREKMNALDRVSRGCGVHYVGIAADETGRLSRLHWPKCAPLALWKMSEADALLYCYQHGYDFGGLYNYLQRVSCWCCRNKNLRELKAYHDHFPEYFRKLVEIEERIGEPMKGKRTLLERFGEVSAA